MKLDDFGQAPNPRRVRIFLVEKGIKIPTDEIDIGTLQHSASFMPSLDRALFAASGRNETVISSPSGARRRTSPLQQCDQA